MRNQTIFQGFTLVAAAFLAAVISNLTASAERRLDWIRTAAPARSEASRVERPAAAPQPMANPAIPMPDRKPPAASAPARSAPPAAAPRASGTSDFQPHPDKAWLEVTPEETRSLFDRGVPFFDARRSSVYREGHIRGARSVSVWEAGLDGHLEEISGERLDPAAPIVVYCSGGDCEDSHLLAERLWGIGLNNVLVYRDGFPDWERRGWPISKGETP